MHVTLPMQLLLKMAAAIKIGTLEIILPDGSSHLFKGTEMPEMRAIWNVRHQRAASRFLTGGILGFCESYLDGDWDTPDMDVLFQVALRNEAELTRLFKGKKWVRFLAWVGHILRPNDKKGSRRNIAYHYDLGNDFYQHWLDDSMTYSSALFKEAQESLESAQHRKYAALADSLGLQAGQHVLEIGCGWGGFAEYAAKHHGVQMTCITISRAQHDFAVARMEKAGLSHLVEIRMQDYRDVTGQFDRIVSIEMFEAVGEAYWPSYFTTLRDRLVSGGKAALQIITIAENRFERYRNGADYIQKYIFPGGMLPTVPILQEQVKKVGLKWIDEAFRPFAQDYATTLKMWNTRFQAAWPKISTLKGFDERFKRMWEQYLFYCAAGFSVGTIDVVHLAIEKP